MTNPKKDYGPAWYAVAELERGTFEPDWSDGLVLDARRVEEPERQKLWTQYGPPD